MQKPMLTIENWAVVQRAVALNYHELQPGTHLMGRVAGHRRLSSEGYVYTSPIVSIDADKGRVETRNTVYMLGKPSEAYLSWEHEHKADSSVSAA